MSFFLGVFPDEKSVHSIKKVVGELGMVFDGFEIPVRWSSPDKFHITVLHLGEKLPIYKRWILQYRLKKLNPVRFQLKLGKVRLGISRKYKELIYIDLEEGGDELRKLFLELKNILKVKTEGNFIPHLTLGRVSKELTDQEHLNICRDLSIVAKKLNIGDIKFTVNEIHLVKSSEGNYEILLTLSDSSKISS